MTGGFCQAELGGSRYGSSRLASVELGAVDPDAVQDDCGPARDRYLALFEPARLVKHRPPSLRPRTHLRPVKQHADRFVQARSREAIGPMRDVAFEASLARLMTAGAA